jgi:hypothetical protein
MMRADFGALVEGTSGEGGGRFTGAELEGDGKTLNAQRSTFNSECMRERALQERKRGTELGPAAFSEAQRHHYSNRICAIASMTRWLRRP